ncbi:MAG: HD domain-containing protein [Desulfosarcinaceae bacterium]
MDKVEAGISGTGVDIGEIFDRYYRPGSDLAKMMRVHGCRVRDKALAAAEAVAHQNPDLDFIAEAALLHDIGIFKTNAPGIGCHGSEPYVRHGVIGRRILENLGLARHALVCERHVGVGLTASDIRSQRLPLPLRDMVPVSIEEILICYADKFFSKSGQGRELPLKAIVDELNRFGQDKARLFLAWHERFKRCQQ